MQETIQSLFSKRLFRIAVITSLVMVTFLLYMIGPAMAASPRTPVQRGATPRAAAHIVYNIYATDGYVSMADGISVYVYGYIGGRAGVPLTYLNQRGQKVTIPAGAPTPTGGPITAAERPLLGNAQIPGPVIYASTGDVVEIRLKNLGVSNARAPNDPHTIHLHGLDVDAANDGVPETSVACVPANAGLPGSGNVVVYMFSVTQPGTYMYHCHQEASIHVQMGMWGALVIYNPTDAAAATGPGMGLGGTLHGVAYNKDVIMLLNEFDTRQHVSEATGGRPTPFNPVNYQPQYWSINGLSFPNTVHAALPATTFNWANWIAAHPGYDPLLAGSAGTGTKLLLRVINLGFETQPMHMHGFHAKVIGKDQRAWPWAYNATTGLGMEVNTLTIGSGETYELLFDFAQQKVSSTYPPAAFGLPASLFAGGTQSRYNAANNLPLSNTLTANPAIPDPFTPPHTYIGGPVVTGLVGVPDPTSQYFPFHNHDDYKATNNGVYPGGMFTLIRMDP